MDTHIVTGINAHKPGYIDESMKDLEKIVGLQTDKPLKRAFMPFGGIKMAEEACSTYGYEPDPELHKIFTQYHKTHNQGVLMYTHLKCVQFVRIRLLQVYLTHTAVAES